MSKSIELFIYDYGAFRSALVKKGADDCVLLDSILLECGNRFGDKYALLNNEAWDSFNPYYSLSALLDSAFPAMCRSDQRYASGSHGVLLHTPRERGISGVERDDIAERLGIELKDE